MSFATARRDIEKRLAANWATTLIAYDNVQFDPPKDTPWIRLRIMEDRVERKTVGSPATHRVFGTVAIDINVLENTGTQTARTYAGTLGTIFRDVQTNGITFREASLVNAGPIEGWYRMALLVPFYWDGIYP